jgi:hypothetical protein
MDKNKSHHSVRIMAVFYYDQDTGFSMLKQGKKVMLIVPGIWSENHSPAQKTQRHNRL